MRTLLVYGFYFIGIIFIVYEVLKVMGLNPKIILDDLEKKSDKEVESNKELDETDKTAEKKMTDQTAFGAFGCLYVIWVLMYLTWGLVGLMSSQWVFFLALFALSFIVGVMISLFKDYQKLIFRVDAFITVMLMVFMLLNRFHWHII